MRGTLFLMALALLLAGCGSKSDEKLPTDVISGSGGTPRMTFDNTHHNFGNVHEGDVVEYSFKFTNTGDGDLLIADASATCGCTIPQYPKYPIPPGKSDYIPVQFNTSGKHDQQTKTITIEANTTPAETQITISAFVLEKNGH